MSRQKHDDPSFEFVLKRTRLWGSFPEPSQKRIDIHPAVTKGFRELVVVFNLLKIIIINFFMLIYQLFEAGRTVVVIGLKAHVFGNKASLGLSSESEDLKGEWLAL